ncbi:MAG: ABC transporter permease [Bacteroidales bacterium]|nr:ABC transporter permease [Bacteroidales bacterium]
MLLHYLALAIRNLIKYKAQNIICILGLAVGILCFTFCLYCTRFVLSTNSCFENSDRIVQLKMKNLSRGTWSSGTTAIISEELRAAGVPLIEGITCIPFDCTLPFKVQISENEILPFSLSTAEIDTAFNSVFKLNILAGSWESAVLQRNSIIISNSTARRIFGEASQALGKTMVLAKRLYNKSTPKTGGAVYTIAAVMEDIPLNTSINFMNHIDAFRLNDSEGFLQKADRGEMTGTETFVMLKENVLPGDLTRCLKEMKYSCRMNGEEFSVFAKKHEVESGFILLAAITLVLGVLILIITLLNFFNFVVSFFYTKTREYTVRKVFGSNLKQLFLQLYIQVVVMLMLSAVVMFSLIEILGNNIHIPVEFLELEMRFSQHLLMLHSIQYVGMLLVANAIICWIVARRLHRMSAYSGIASKPAGGNVIGRNIMLWWQLFITWIFLGLVYGLTLQSRTSFSNIFTTLSNQQKREILSVPMDWFFMDNAGKEVLIEKFRQHSGVIDIMITDISLVEGYSGYIGLNWDGQNKDSEFSAGILSIPYNYFSFMNASLLSGTMPVSNGEVVVDNRFAKKRKIDVLGKNVFSKNGCYTICGVTQSHNFTTYDGDDSGFIFIPDFKINKMGHCYIKCHPEYVSEVRKWVSAILSKELPSNVEFRVNTLLDDILDVQIIEHAFRKIFVFFALVCIIITMLGVYSSISFDTIRRQKEVALRKINGAGKFNIAWVFIRLYAILLATSAAVAFPLLYFVFGFWKQMYVKFFDCNITFWLVLFAFLSIVVALTIAWKVNKIVRLNPVEVIKSE